MVERKMQSLPPPEHRRVLLYVTFLALSLLAFSCWALINSRINNVIPESVLMLVIANKTSESYSNGGDLTLKQLPNSVARADEMPNSGSRQRVRQNSGALGGQRNEKCDLDSALLKVYMYDLPPEFHFGMLGWKGKGNETWPDVRDANRVPRYPGGLNLQHSVAYWLTLDILSSNLPGMARPCVAIRVMNSSLADVFFVPFFASLSYNRHSKLHGKEKISRNRFLQGELVKYLRNQEEWRRWGGKNHLVIAHHPNSMLDARKKLRPAMLVLSDFGRYSPEVANLKKDIIAPYRHVIGSLGDDSPTFEERPLLAYFQGAIYRKDGGMIRQKLYQLLKDEKDVHFSYGSVRQNGIKLASKGMASSRYCLNIAGDTPSSNRLFDAIVSHCVPVIISDEIELPFEDVLDYSKFSIFVRASDAVKKGFLLNTLRGIAQDEWTSMWQRLKEIAHHFEYQYPSKPGDAVQMIWEAVARKMSSVNLEIHKRGRFDRSRFAI